MSEKTYIQDSQEIRLDDGITAKYYKYKDKLIRVIRKPDDVKVERVYDAPDSLDFMVCGLDSVSHIVASRLDDI